MKCASCAEAPPVLRRSVNKLPYCKQCFIKAFEDEVYDVIQENKLIVDGDVVCIGVSGGKDSSVLAHVLATLKERYERKWTLFLLAADEGIKGYRDDSLNVVMGMQNPNYDGLKILNFKERFGFDMDEVVALIGKKNNCTVCGTFRRQILEIGARLLGANKLCTGHNIDDNAETVLLNICRNDLFKLAKNLNGSVKVEAKESQCDEAYATPSPKGTDSSDKPGITEYKIEEDLNGLSLTKSGVPCASDIHAEHTLDGSEGGGDNTKGTEESQYVDTTKIGNSASSANKIRNELIRIKPMMYCFEKEIVMYARYLKLEYFSTECIYAPEAYRGYMRTFIKQLEAVDPKIIQNITHSSQRFYAQYQANRKMNTCKVCGIEGINDLCKACILVDRLTQLRCEAKDHVQKTSKCCYTSPGNK
ncbi:Cytoplasmic tRNA 2-thiolation protein 1 [Babesia sp. Xinjiang]|uniref:Cytoplasmic tRNA 2-thiolation protein 1 n=1 Tax=Babesia sp. Xinjiang TaxID=462227 RepID=UPI000A258EAB|nr:Cytoplasmic tRNA 2-thiolation protein 1 [Babesia sp. Xinjiang]ORM40174.1 Cytoplasmic tRNA 2-thiolation protein 1 [Babesia sp. Xinjiang]